jgi:type VI secretion system secreted protein VgrG
MELEGIYYYFKHEQNQHTLVLADDVGSHEPMPGYETINYFAADREVTEDMEVIRDWQPSEELRSGSYTVDDFNFTTPKGDLVNVRSQPTGRRQRQLRDVRVAGRLPGRGRWRALRTRAPRRVAGPGAAKRGPCDRARHGAGLQVHDAQLAALGRQPGVPGGGRQLLAARRRLRDGAAPGEYNFDFVVQPTALAFRAPRQTPPPRTSGPQTATVVGPEGEEIWTDQYGRVKVQFHWDRYGQRNENSSRFVRVSHIWAGERFGGVFTPRIGQEVIVDFIGGRPDRPVIVGRVYNADQMPPFALPGEATKSGIVTRSSKGGSQATANAFVFEDKMGAEQILVHAERNLDVEVEATRRTRPRRHARR